MAYILPDGAVIMFDGPNWVGKSTQVALAVEALGQQGYKVWTTRVNGGSPIGEALRDVMRADFERPVMTDLHIHLAQQYSLCAEVIRKRREGFIILIDRSPLSIIAYQVYGEGLEEKIGYDAVNEVLALHQPELIIAYTAPHEVLQKRRGQISQPADHFESQGDNFFKRVAEGYTVGARHYGARIIDASGDAGHVHAESMSYINFALSQAAGQRVANDAAPSSSGSGH